MNRIFVPNFFNVDSSSDVANLYQKLLDEDIPETKEALRAWILRWSELNAVLSETSSRRYVKMTCDTSNESAAKAYADFIENIAPVEQKYDDLLNKKLVQHPALKELEPEFECFFKSVKVALELFNEKNIPLETEEQKEVQAYQKITGSMSVNYDGKIRTLQQMNKFLEIADSNKREDAYRTIWKRRLQDSNALDDAYTKFFNLRNSIAKNAGCKDYIEYIFKAKGRFDYTPADCKTFHESIEKLILPIQKKIYKKRQETMGLKTLRPWDLHVDPLAREPLKPFRNGSELIEKCDRIFEGLNNKAGAWARQMQAERLIDPESRLGKAPGGYQIGFEETKLPFIFMNAAGSDRDIYTLLHESGHSFHQFAMAKQPIVAYRDISAEFAEVASMSMELIGQSKIDVFYPNAAEANRSRKNNLEDVIWLFPWVACIDSFQHELYARQNHSVKDRHDIWLSIMDRFDTGVDYSGLEDIKSNFWQKQLHLFECPFYYIEYGIAELGALQVYANFKRDPEKAFDMLFKAESLGSSRPLPELFETAGIKFDFTPKTIEPLMQLVCDELESL